MDAARDQEKGLFALLLDIQTTVSFLAWMLGSELQPTPSELLTSKSSASSLENVTFPTPHWTAPQLSALRLLQ